MILNYTYYGANKRTFPVYGLIYRKDDPSGKYRYICVYSRKLTEKECLDYEMEEIDG